ncbi:hypothetical protein [Streptomyces celluloflavus]|uniref:hypothetical protein n=1 Tax=Streptomyces celluloflavus TaxID=58344 RepID=UPI003663118E
MSDNEDYCTELQKKMDSLKKELNDCLSQLPATDCENHRMAYEAAVMRWEKECDKRGPSDRALKTDVMPIDWSAR